MRSSLSRFALLLAGLIALPAVPIAAAPAVPGGSGAPSASPPWIARGGGGGGGRGGGGARGGGGGGARGGGAPRAHSGFQGSGSSFSRGDRRPQGGFSEGNRVTRVGNPSLDRPSRANGTRERGGPRPEGSRPDRSGDRNLGNRGDRNLADRSLSIDRNWNRNVNIANVNLRPGWARPGWGVARPWNWGWYGGWSTPPWGWWGARAAAWGIGTLATAAIINDAVNDAVQANQTAILVPNSDYQLLYGSVQPSNGSLISFIVQANGNNYEISADCQRGLLNGREPNNAAEAELLNAACQVAFGTAD
jgi:hypothetical protein